MSDAGRQDIGDKVKAAVTPESQKSTGESIGDTLKGKADNVAGKATPEEDKSILQKASDAVFGK